ncbi:HAD family hydrolase [Streptomyces polyrhachis]|uniref:HAD family hydrolase n=1 Tax=Streptomyces polyrhachis TaxID=1282885 RepID=A0ABW2GBR0_9ACTN
MNKPVELVIFDCDGVLVDTERLAVHMQIEIGADLGWILTPEEVVDHFMGKSEASVHAMVAARLGTRSADVWHERNRAMHKVAIDTELTAVEGVVEALDALDADGLPYCVASSGPHEKMRHTLGRTGLWDRLEGRIYSATEVPRGKPAPDLFLHAARGMGCAPEVCVVVEDSQYGVQAARAAGMRSLGFAGGLSPAAWLAGEGTVLFDHMRELPDAIRALG